MLVDAIMLRTRALRFALCFLLAFLFTFGLLPMPAFALDGPYLLQNTKRATYATTVTAATPAASPTDILTIQGSATSTIYIKRISCSVTATASGFLTVSLVKRSAADTAGTSSAPTVVRMDSNSPTPSAATLALYTANPTGLGTTTGAVRVFGGGTTATVPAVFSWTFGNQDEQEPTLRGTGQYFALNGGGAAWPTGSLLYCDVTWEEAASQ